MIRIARTENGVVRGIEASDPRITIFKGIPYAAPPVGKNRWRKPQKCADWQGIRDASRFAPAAMQDIPGLGDDIYTKEWHVDPEIEMSEDCLYLNIWTNAKVPEDKLPVMIWFFGGAYQWGYPQEMEFDGERLAGRGVIVVSVNYRINVFGFLAHPELTKEQSDAPTNFGYLDQLAGMLWVRKNITAFGGDPEQITIAGQSAGGGSVMAHLTSEKSRGLFQKAIIESGVFSNPYREKIIFKTRKLISAEAEGDRFFHHLGVNNLKEAREVSARTIRDQYAEYVKKYSYMGPVIDDRFCRENPLSLFMKNEYCKVPILTGNTSDEFISSIDADTKDELTEKIKKLFAPDHEQLFNETNVVYNKNSKHYFPINTIETATKAMIKRNLILGNQNPIYYYYFDADIPGDHAGCFHSVDLWFFFETLSKSWRPFHGRHYDLSRKMCSYWGNFIKTGDPNGVDRNGDLLPEWKCCSMSEPYGIIFSEDYIRDNSCADAPILEFMIEKCMNEMT